MIRTEVAWFADVMETKLKENDHKGGWDSCDVEYLLKRLGEELLEIHNALGDGLSDETIIRECADVANFAMMIADKYRIKRFNTSPADIRGSSKIDPLAELDKLLDHELIKNNKLYGVDVIDKIEKILRHETDNLR